MEISHVRQLLISVTFAVAIAAHVFVASWALSAFPWLRRRRRAFVVVAVAVFLTAPVGRLFGLFYWKSLASSFTAVGATEWMTVMLGALPLAVIVGVGKVAALTARAAPTPTTARDAAAAPSTETEQVTRRVVIERAAGLAVFGVAGGALGWGAVIGRHDFHVEEVVVRLAGLPKALEGYTIAQISDIHAGLFVGERELEEGFAKVRALKADLVVATGDLLDFDVRFAPWLARRLGDLRGRDGVAAILGNHDYYAGYTLVVPAMRAAGVDLLLNDGRTIRPSDGGGFALLGVDDLWAYRSGGLGPDLDRAMSMVRPDAPSVLLAHQPSFFRLARGRVGLQLSGHTHGGQINPGFTPASFVMPYVAGRYDELGSSLWVNRGFGVAGPPARIGAPPEVTKVVLVSA